MNKLTTEDSLYSQKPFPLFSKPSMTGYFSLDENRHYHNDASRLQYLSLPNNLRDVRFDLTDGYKEVIRKPEDAHHEKINHLLNFILTNIDSVKNQDPSKKQWLNTDFVCFRGLLTVIMCTPYEQQEGWIITATKYKGTIYLCAVETEEKKINRYNTSEQQKKFMSWGYKFEQYLSSVSPQEKPVTTKPVIESEEFCGVFQTKLVSHRLMFGAEMDGAKSKTILAKGEDIIKAEFVELKTSRHIQYTNQDRNFRKYKLIKWWCQSFLVGIKEIYCGFRNDHGIVEEIRPYKVNELVKMSSSFWDPSVCMNFCNEFLLFVKNTVGESSHPVVWRFYWTPGHDITYCIDDQNLILPNWFTNNG